MVRLRVMVVDVCGIGPSTVSWLKVVDGSGWEGRELRRTRDREWDRLRGGSFIFVPEKRSVRLLMASRKPAPDYDRAYGPIRG
jgi:hypothetical protein